MPIGYLIFTVLMAAGVLLIFARIRPSRSSPIRLSHVLTWLINESPFLAFVLLVASTALAILQFGVDSPVAWIGFGLSLMTTVGLVILAERAARTRSAVEEALSDGLGAGRPRGVDPRLVARLGHRPSLLRALYAPFPLRHPGVERVSNIAYADDGSRAHRLDLYRPRSSPPTGPTLIHFHGGAFMFGAKSREARALLYRLARHGWTCVSANYRLRRAARFPDPLIDVKLAIAWVRAHGPRYGADPEVIFLAGSSSGAYLAALAALTPNEPAFQPDFENVDTEVSAAIGLYGYYGEIGEGRQEPSSPTAHIGEEAPPFFIAHGDLDSLVIVEDVRRFVGHLRAASAQPVVFAELPGASHGFDYFDSIRLETVIDGVESFAAWVEASRSRTQAD
jgi:acetyl esterase/lipase